MQNSPLGRILPCLLLCASASFGQSVQGSLTGVVRDSSRAVIAGATIVVTSESTNNSVKVTTQPDGVYLAPLLLAGITGLPSIAPDLSASKSGVSRLTSAAPRPRTLRSRLARSPRKWRSAERAVW